MMRESFPDAARIEEKQVHRIRGESIPDDAVGLYVAVFDVIARGMGSDAHTAGEPLIGDSQRNRGRGVYGETEIGAASDHPAPRGILEGARHTLCLAAGGEKAEAIRRVLRGPFDPVETRA
jgi:6-phosphogluconolactonase/glucosamine-6-phosphate isomerase/deaminase